MGFRQSFISLRWLLVILTCYLTVFSDQGPGSAALAVFVLLFTLTNAVLSWVPNRLFTNQRFIRCVDAADVIFVAFGFYWLQVRGTQLHLAFILVFLLTVIWRDLRIVLFSVVAVSLLYGFFTFSHHVNGDLDNSTEAFLPLALLFVVANFHVFLTSRIKQDAELSMVMQEETRRAEVMSEITRSLSSLLDSNEIFGLIVTRLQEVAGAEDVWIVRLGSQSQSAKIAVRASAARAPIVPLVLKDWPEMVQALESKTLMFMPDVERDGVRKSVVAVPMVVKDAVLGLIHLHLSKKRRTLSGVEVRFLNIMADTAANALRNAELFEEMERRARTDFLTGLANHRYFQSRLSIELARAERHNRPLSLLMIDLDFLKQVNDRFGHPCGDRVIRSIADTIRQTCREIDFAARYGGEEFAVILPETELNAAIQVADRMRERIAEVEFPGIGSITASIGVSNYPMNAIGSEDLIRIADQALYMAKNNGRDRVASFSYQLITRES